VGFDWPNVDGLFDKLHEETEELREQLKEFPAPGPRPQYRNSPAQGTKSVPTNCALAWRKRVGDLFFVLVNVARYLSIDPESALKKRTASSNGAFSGWKNTCAPPADLPNKPPWKNSKHYGQQAKRLENFRP